MHFLLLKRYLRNINPCTDHPSPLRRSRFTVNQHRWNHTVTHCVKLKKKKKVRNSNLTMFKIICPPVLWWPPQWQRLSPSTCSTRRSQGTGGGSLSWTAPENIQCYFLFIFWSIYIVHGSDLLSKVLGGDVEYVGVGGRGEEVGQGLGLHVPAKKLNICQISQFIHPSSKTMIWWNIHFNSLNILAPLPPPVRPDWLNKQQTNNKQKTNKQTNNKKTTNNKQTTNKQPLPPPVRPDWLNKQKTNKKQQTNNKQTTSPSSSPPRLAPGEACGSEANRSYVVAHGPPAIRWLKKENEDLVKVLNMTRDRWEWVSKREWIGAGHLSYDLALPLHLRVQLWTWHYAPANQLINPPSLLWLPSFKFWISNFILDSFVLR